MGVVVDFEKLETIIAREKLSGKKIVNCHGVFDLLHVGHLRYLRQAKEMGDILVVTMTADQFVDKGPGRPAFTETLRAEALASLVFVDYVAINLWPTAVESITRLRPHYFVKGIEFKGLKDPTGKIKLEAEAAEKVGTEMRFVDDIVFSSSNLINRYFSSQSEDMQKYLSLFKERHPLENVKEWLAKLSDLEVVVVGDCIIDEYITCKTLGVSSKDPTLAVQQMGDDIFAGGAVAVARHIAGLVKHVTLLTMVGEKDPYNAQLADALKEYENITVIAEERKDAPTVRKTRYLDAGSTTKLLEIYHIDQEPMSEQLDERMIHHLEELCAKYPLIVAADFGHGCISKKMINYMAENAKYLAVNTQANAGNRGYHSIEVYPRADFISLAEHEMRMTYRDTSGDIAFMMSDLAERKNTDIITVTRGKNGSVLLQKDVYTAIPSFASKVIDKVGAGDALFSVSALSAYVNAPLEVIGIIGSIAGALMVEKMGNSVSVTHQDIQKSLTAALK